MVEWKWLALGAAFFAGLTAVLAKIGVKDLPVSLAALVRTAVVFALLAAVVSIKREWGSPAQAGSRTLWFLILSGLTTGVSWLCYYGALKTGPASLVAPVDKLSLVFSVAFAVMFLGERLGPLQWAGVTLMTVGAVLVASK